MQNKECGNIKKYKTNKFSYLLLGFNDGISTLSQLAINYFFKDVLKVVPSTLTQLLTIIQLPWMIKPLFGLISDILPICGYRRKVYIIICGLLNCLSWIIMAFFVKSIFQSVVWLIIVNISISFSSVLGQAIIVEMSKSDSSNNTITKNDSNDLVSWYFVCKYCGVFLASFLKGYLIEQYSIQMVFIVSACFPIVTLISGLILYEERIIDKKHKSYVNIDKEIKEDNFQNIGNDNQEISSNTVEQNQEHKNDLSISNAENESLFKKFCFFFCEKEVIIPTSYMIFLLSIPNYRDTLWYYCNDELKLTPSNFGTISIFNTLSTIIAILIFKIFLSKTKFRKVVNILHIITVLSAFLINLLIERVNLDLKINDFYFVLISTSIFLSSNELTSMPMMTLACNLCPKNLEGSVYAMFISALNFGDLMSSFLGSMITKSFGIKTGNYKNFWKLVLISNILEIIPIPVLLCIPENYFPLHQDKIIKRQTVKEVTIEMSDNNAQALSIKSHKEDGLHQYNKISENEQPQKKENEL